MIFQCWSGQLHALQFSLPPHVCLAKFIQHPLFVEPIELGFESFEHLISSRGESEPALYRKCGHLQRTVGRETGDGRNDLLVPFSSYPRWPTDLPMLAVSECQSQCSSRVNCLSTNRRDAARVVTMLSNGGGGPPAHQPVTRHK